MKRVLLAGALVLLMLVPAANASANDCPSIEGRALLDYGRTNTGTALVIYDGQRLRVDFIGTGFVPTGPNTADVHFDWLFPDGTVSLVEHSTTTPIVGPLVAFDSTVEVTSGGSGDWTWSGISNVAAGNARFELSGTLCIDA